MDIILVRLSPLISPKRKIFLFGKIITTLFHLKDNPECYQSSNLSFQVVRHLTEKSCSLVLNQIPHKVCPLCLVAASDPFQSVGFLFTSFLIYNLLFKENRILMFLLNTASFCWRRDCFQKVHQFSQKMAK